jgi:predicted nucleic acid-binding protein
MPPEKFVFDASALITLIDDEAGSERVSQILQEEDVIIPWPAILEVVYVSRQKRGEAEADYRFALLRKLPATILWEMDEPLLLTASRFKASYRASLGDALIAAYAFYYQARLLHKDPEFEQFEGNLSMEALPYKIPKGK